ncbi:50S ribosomal protein L28 [Candidatus Dojkabacteria bacterium]|uniref:Large ribosomal subunit protein bL28 n=1 Tax=Candidatus Dojkabacteria bacterium TaxID=2099670 RepID=A0A955L5S7_9BACT|nr:50S ribosomal protein L28 [Candidatus Dojkabacteria bacterium]
MARKDDLTGKKTMFGGARKHQRGSSGGGGVWRFKAQRTARTWRPNLRKVRLMDLSTGKVANYKVAMKTYKKLRKEGQFQNYVLADNNQQAE